MNNIVLIFSIIIITLIGCESEILKTQDDQKYLLKKIYSSPDNYKEYFYNPLAKIIRAKSYYENPWGEVYETETNYEYDDNGNKIIKETNYSTITGVPEYSYLTYEYNDQNLISKTKAYLKMGDGNYELRSTTKYDYDDYNRLVKTKIYSPDNVERKLTELFYDVNGNVIETNLYQDGNLSFTDKYEYDSKINPLRQNIAGSSVYTISKNNPIKHFSTNFMMENDNSITVYNFEYNSDGYPISYIHNSQKFYFEYY